MLSQYMYMHSLQGKRESENVDYNPSLYQIRSNGSKLCRRIVQVPVRPQTLNSCFWCVQPRNNTKVLEVILEQTNSGHNNYRGGLVTQVKT